MASERLLDALLAIWSMYEARARRYIRGSMSPLPVTPEAQEALDSIATVMDCAASGQSDRAVAKKYPDVVKAALCDSPSYWSKIAPEETR